MHDQRRLTTIVSADVVGYSRLMGRDESGTLAALKAHLRELIDPKIAEYGGRTVKSMGDGLLLEFPSVVDAVRCVVDMQRGMAERNVGVPDDQQICFRIGINVGDIIIDGDDIFGDGVNVAARLQTLADPGGICVSRGVRDQVLDKLSFAFEDLGAQEVKNIARPVEVFRIRDAAQDTLPGRTSRKSARLSSLSRPASRGKRWRLLAAAAGGLAVATIVVLVLWQQSKPGSDATQSRAGIASSATMSAGPLSIVVLPFANLTGDASQAYVADGLTASLTSDLSRIRDAFIVNAATAFAYKDKPVTAQQVGKELGVHFVLQGSVQRNGTRIRINAHLADAESNAQLWSENFEGDQSDLFALQDRVTTLVGNSIGREMVIAAARDSETRKSSPKVADLMLRARALIAAPRSLKNLQQSESLYRQVLTLEPDNAKAMSGLAHSLVAQADNFGFQMDKGVKEEKFAEGRDLAVKARELDPNNPEVYNAIGLYAVNHNDLDGARRAYETWLSLAPKLPNPYNNPGNVLVRAGEFEKAIEVLNKGINLDPKHPYDLLLLQIGRAYLLLGDNDAAIEWLSKSVDKNPSLVASAAWLAMAYAEKGDDAKARAMAGEVRRLDPNLTLSSWRGPPTSNPSAIGRWMASKGIPAWRKAGLPE